MMKTGEEDERLSKDEIKGELKELLLMRDKADEYEDTFMNEVYLMNIAAEYEIEKQMNQIQFYYDQLEKATSIEREILNETIQFNKERQMYWESASRELKKCEKTKNQLQNQLKNVKRVHQSKKKQLEKNKRQEEEMRNHVILQEIKSRKLNQEVSELKHEVKQLKQEKKNLKEESEELYLLKKKMNNQIQQMRGNIRVCCRVRPISEESQSIVNVLPEEAILQLRMQKENQKIQKHDFRFEYVFGPNDGQKIVFDELAQLIQSSIDGKSVCIFAYGQTGSGKTYTMQGGNTEQTKGIIPRSVELIFEQLVKAKEHNWDYQVKVHISELYIDVLKDLLTNKNMTDEEEKEKALQGFVVSSPEEIYSLLKEAWENRKVAETKCNERSSRSHLIFTISLTAVHKQKKVLRKGSLNLIDLAGSERLDSSKVEGERMKQTVSINKSLSQLGTVINALANKDAHIPFRSSKLTRVLQGCLTGDSKTLMLVNISPQLEDYNQTINSLRFASQVKECKIRK